LRAKPAALPPFLLGESKEALSVKDRCADDLLDRLRFFEHRPSDKATEDQILKSLGVLLEPNLGPETTSLCFNNAAGNSSLRGAGKPLVPTRCINLVALSFLERPLETTSLNQAQQPVKCLKLMTDLSSKKGKPRLTLGRRTDLIATPFKKDEKLFQSLTTFPTPPKTAVE
jgi:hypothetical protein